MSLKNTLRTVLRDALRRRPGSNRRPRPRRPVLEVLEDRLCPSDFSVVATGLDNPRGLAFGPDGQLYVAQGGPATNTLSTTGDPTVQQVPPPVGPYTGGYNSSIVRINPATGASTTVVSGLPSSQTSPAAGSLVSGVSAVAFLGNTLYGMEAGAGSSHGLAGTDNTLFRVNPDGTTTTVADLSAFVKANPVAFPEPSVPPGDFEPDGTWYGMVAVRGAVYATEPNHQEVDKITPDGQVSRVIDMSVQFPGTIPPNDWVGPTGIAYHGNFYVGTLGQFPVTPGSESIYKITPSGQLTTAASGLTAVLGVAFDAQGRLYALETDTVAGFPGPDAAGSGKVVRVNGNGTLTTIASGLTFPTAMTFGPDGNLYVSNIGFGVPVPGAGEIVRIDVSAALDAPVVPLASSAAGGTSSGSTAIARSDAPQAAAAPGQPGGADLPTRADGPAAAVTSEPFAQGADAAATNPAVGDASSPGGVLPAASPPARSGPSDTGTVPPPAGTTGPLPPGGVSFLTTARHKTHRILQWAFEDLGGGQP
jgi:hypothetical protein